MKLHALAVLAAARVVASLQVAPGSPCANVCIDSASSDVDDPDASNTDSSDIVCDNEAYTSTPGGKKFQRCLTCLQTSGHEQTGETDQQWFICGFTLSLTHSYSLASSHSIFLSLTLTLTHSPSLTHSHSHDIYKYSPIRLTRSPPRQPQIRFRLLHPRLPQRHSQQQPVHHIRVVRQPLRVSRIRHREPGLRPAIPVLHRRRRRRHCLVVVHGQLPDLSGR